MRRLTVLLACCALLTANAQDKPKKKRPPIHEAAIRAFDKANKERVNHNGYRRVTLNDDMSEDSGKVLIIVEFLDGTIGLFAAFEDDKEDQWMVLEKKNCELVWDVLRRDH